MLIFCLELHERLMGSMSAASNRYSENKPLNCPGRTAFLFDYYALVWEGEFKGVTYTCTHTFLKNISEVVVPMPWPTPWLQLPLLLPLIAICVVVPQVARSSLSSSSSHMTSDMPSDPAGALLGCSPRTLTTQALLRHLSPIRKPSLFDTKQLGPGLLWPLSWGKMKMEWRVGKEEEDIKSSTQCEIHPSALGGCRLAVCQGQGHSVGVEYLQKNIQKTNAELCPFLHVQSDFSLK